MAKTSAKTDATDTPVPTDPSDLSPENLAQAVYDGLGPRVRQETTLEEIRAVADRLVYKDKRPTRPAPVLMVKRLMFKGMKTLVGQEPIPIDYAQEFAPGVNVILIERNLVGKSSILKTIKFALTGDHEEYDRAVREWIKEVWLQFSLGTRPFTVILAERNGAWHGLLVPGEECRPYDQVFEDLPRKDTEWAGLERIREGLARFFFREYSLASLGWSNSKADGETAEQTASWQTYFQALRIKDDDHKYLLCEPVPGLANQEFILATAFLGLHLAEPLNQLGLRQSALKKAKQRNDTEAEGLRADRARFQGERREAEVKFAELRRVQNERRQSVLAGDLPGQTAGADRDLLQVAVQITELQREKQSLATQAQQERAQAKRLRALARLQREFTGLDVTLCPCCAKPIDPSLITREAETYECRLCHKTASAASEEDAEGFEFDAKQCEEQAQDYQRGEAAAGRKIVALQEEETRLRQRTASLRQSMAAGISAALPRPEEEAEKDKLSHTLGRIDHQIWLLDQRLEKIGEGGADPEKEGKVVQRVREKLQEEAARRNEDINARLKQLAQGVIAALGAEQITGIKCSALGKISLEKNGVEVTFGGIKNPGERFRVKLALFLAMMQLGREKGGRHPGFLLIDQLGAAEMIPEHLRASAKVLHSIDTAFGTQVQLICCTAKPEFRDATDGTKVYGHKVSGPNGELWAF